jgi:CHAT domain-containing protein
LLVFADAGPFPGFAPEAYAWALTKTDVRWTKLSINYLGILRLVQALRCGLDRDGNWVWSSSTNRWQAREKGCAAIRPDGLAREELLPFDLARAHALYQALIGPFEDMIEGKKVLIVPPAQMATLPPSVLVTEVPDPAFTGPEAFRKAAWWGRRQPITVLPSVSSLQVLRGFAKPPQAIHPMIGFGNPLLDGDPSNPEHAQRAAVAQQKQSCRSRPLRDAESQRLVTPRSFTGPVPRKGTIDLEAIRAAPPLPETADELCAVANVLGATEDDIFLGSRATKTAVLTKSAEGVLARYRIVHFATHGLLAGETQLFATGHAEPALLMTPPRAQAGTDDPQHDDGLLTASDVGQLQLNAEWVILSACNTAAGGEMGGEAFSGLARAFFYAGARALLVSHWYVDSDATVRLVTRATSELQSEPTMTRSEALRRAMMALIDDTSNERTVHPATWAPFVVVGEGAR